MTTWLIVSLLALGVLFLWRILAWIKALSVQNLGTHRLLTVLIEAADVDAWEACRLVAAREIAEANGDHSGFGSPLRLMAHRANGRPDEIRAIRAAKST